VIGTGGGTPVRVRDVGQVEDGAEELRHLVSPLSKKPRAAGRRGHSSSPPIWRQHRARGGRRQEKTGRLRSQMRQVCSFSGPRYFPISIKASRRIR